MPVTTISVSESAQKNHSALLGLALPVLSTSWRERALHIAEVESGAPSCRRDDDLVMLAHDASVMLQQVTGPH